MTHRVILRMEVDPAHSAEFEATWTDIGRAIASEPANLGQTLVRDTQEDGVYFVLTDWESEAAFRAFELSAPHVENRRRLGRYRTGGSMHVTEVVTTLPPGRRPR